MKLRRNMYCGERKQYWQLLNCEFIYLKALIYLMDLCFFVKILAFVYRSELGRPGFGYREEPEILPSKISKPRRQIETQMQ